MIAIAVAPLRLLYGLLSPATVMNGGEFAAVVVGTQSSAFDNYG